MTKEQIIKKLTSRKFWAAVVSFVGAILVYFNADANAEQIASIIWAGASLIAYIVGEGLVDAANAKIVITDTQEAEVSKENSKVGF